MFIDYKTEKNTRQYLEIRQPPMYTLHRVCFKLIIYKQFIICCSKGILSKFYGADALPDVNQQKLT